MILCRSGHVEVQFRLVLQVVASIPDATSLDGLT